MLANRKFLNVLGKTPFISKKNEPLKTFQMINKALDPADINITYAVDF